MSNSREGFVLRLVFLFLVSTMICPTAFAEAPWKFITTNDSRSEGIGGVGVNTTILAENSH